MSRGKIKRDKNKALEWVSVFVSAKDSIIKSESDEIKTWALLLVGCGLRPDAYNDDRGIPLEEINSEHFSLTWGIADSLKSALLADSKSGLWKIKDGYLTIPFYAHKVTSRQLTARNNGRKGGLKKAQNRRRDNTPAQESGYTMPANLKQYDN